jgi:sigma-B regulation protein RsbU (phosphoserine phosphatase)
VIADVSGKGVPAALFMAVARTLLRATAPAAVRPGACLTLTNNLLSQDNEATMFVTLFYGIIDMETHELTYANGGHNPPLILGPSGEIKTLPRTGGMALGVMEDIPYHEHTITLEPGSLLLLYTDGVTEAFSPANEEFTETRLIATLAACRNLPVEETLERIVTAVTGFADTAPQSDDITCLAVRYDLLPAPLSN